MWRIQDHQAVHQVGKAHRERPGNRAAPVVANEDSPIGVELSDRRRDILHQLRDSVGGSPSRLVALVVTAQIEGDGEMIAAEFVQLVPPRVPELGKPVQEEDQLSPSGRNVMQPDAVSLQVAVYFLNGVP